MTARDNILRRLASADFRLPTPVPDVSTYYREHRPEEDAAARLARFRTAITAAHAEVHDTTAVHWPEKLYEITAAKGLRTLLVGAASPDAVRLAASPDDRLTQISYQRNVDEWRSELFTTIDAGLTRAKSAIAATGSLVLWPDAHEPRLMSLVPPVHFVLLDADAIHADLQQAMTAENWSNNLPSNALLVSGPSKTADIQQTLAYGAHGPRELVILIIHPAGERS